MDGAKIREAEMKSKSIAGLAALAMLMGVAAGGSFATAANNVPIDSFAKRVFAGKVADKGKSYACFVRRYDAAHLAKHPAQKVTSMRLLVSAELVPEDKALNYTFAMALTFRDRRGNFSSGGSCGHPTASQETADKLVLGCSVDCDGGGVSLELVNADKSVLLSIDRVAIWDDNKPDDERASLEGGTDDRKFRLDRVSLDQCRSLIPPEEHDEAEKPATM
jgi:hypothetical protein